MEVTGDSAIRPFAIDVPQETLDRIRDRVAAFRWTAWADAPFADDWRFGPPFSFMRELCRYWVDQYDWRAQERAMSACPNFKVVLDGIGLHYIHVTASNPHAVPLLIAHGWPYSSHSYNDVAAELAHPELHGADIGDAFNVVVPSFPGYGFSDRPPEPMGPRAIAFLLDKLMMRLGYDRYIVHGGDWGAHVTSLLGFHRPSRVMGIHSTALALREDGAEQLTGKTPTDASVEEAEFAAAEHAIWQLEGAYSQLHATKPAKLGYAMMDSPVGTAAWIVEAFYAWSDRQDRSFTEIFSYDQLINEVMLYLVTDAFPTSTWIYGAKRHEEATLPPSRRVSVPTALAAFRDPVFPMPTRSVAQKSHDVVRYVTMPRGGHFPFYEAPDLLVDDLRAFRRQLT